MDIKHGRELVREYQQAEAAVKACFDAMAKGLPHVLAYRDAIDHHDRSKTRLVAWLLANAAELVGTERATA